MELYNPIIMLDGMTFFTHDAVWRRILSDLGATAAEEAGAADVVFAPPARKLSPTELKAEFLRQLDEQRAATMFKIFGGCRADVSPTQEKVALLLFKNNGMTIKQLNEALGYSADTRTHTTDTVIYQLRKIFGPDFIKNDNGIYRLQPR